jgi:hypothetical protein
MPAKANNEVVDAKGKLVETVRRLVKERLFFPLVKENVVGDNEMDSEFMDSEPDFDVVCNVVSILPAKYDVVSEIEESEEDYNPKDMEKYKSMCCCVTDNGYGNQQKVIFEKPNCSMRRHLKPLFIQAKIDDNIVKLVLVDGGAAVNLMPQSLLKKIGKRGTPSESHCRICH